jgi:hypothetical protein
LVLQAPLITVRGSPSTITVGVKFCNDHRIVIQPIKEKGLDTTGP